MALRVFLLFCVLFGAACKKCRPGPPAAGVVLRDAKTKAPICDATVTFEDGSYREVAKSVPLGNSCVFSAISARPGSYRVVVVAPGHAQTTTAIAVARDEDDRCHLRGATVTLEL